MLTSPPVAPAEQLSLFAELPRRVVALDLETQRSFEDVGGRDHLELLGLAVAVVYDSLTHGLMSYWEADAARLILHLKSADLVVGYNLLGFDYRVLEAYGHDLPRRRTLDLMIDLERKLGFRPRLDDVLEANLGLHKSADGLQSLRWWKAGRADLVEEYCRNDVRATWQLYQHGCRSGRIQVPSRDGPMLEVEVDWRAA
jgi:DEAD/DEAH box helicase domain-containing protein